MIKGNLDDHTKLKAKKIKINDPICKLFVELYDQLDLSNPANIQKKAKEQGMIKRVWDFLITGN